MKLETFFEKFELFADAPNAVTKMRELVLQLAVQGKLVDQDPNDEPEPISADGHIDVPFEIPESWSWIHLADLQPDFQNGASSRGDKDGLPVIVIRLADVDNRRISLDNPRAVNIARDHIAKYRLEIGDTLITRVNGSADIVGTFIPILESVDAIYCDHFIRMRITPELAFPAYIALVGDSELVREQIRSLFITTAGQKTVNQGHIRSLSIPIPPFAEQRRIVAKVDELMALCDQLEVQQKERDTQHSQLARASLDRFALAPSVDNLNFIFHKSFSITPAELRKTILTLAVQGHLSAIRASIVEEQTALLDSATDPQFPISYGVLKPGPQVANGVRLVKSQHIRDWKVSEDIEYLISAELDAEFKRTKIKGGEVLLNLVGASIGRCAIAPASLKGANVSRAVAVITLRAEVDPKFFLILLTAAFTPERIEALSSGTAQPVLNLGVIRKIKIWLPPLAEQRRIVAKVEQLMALVDELETQIAATRAAAAHLLSALVAELTTRSGGVDET